MPFYDRICNYCGWLKPDILEAIGATLDCPECGKPTERAWLTKAANVIGDEMDHTQVNGLKTPRRFRSKQEHRRWLKDNNYVINDGHVGEQGSDKNKHSTRWATGGKQWMDDAIELAKRNGASAGKDPGEKPFHIKWTTGTLSEAQIEDYRKQVR